MKYGIWIYKEKSPVNGRPALQCSVCKTIRKRGRKTGYCPDCGAAMVNATNR